MKYVIASVAVLGLAACGGGRSSAPQGGTLRAESGPVSQACMASDRKARSAGLCGCIQAAANRTLSAGDQRRAISFYKDPHEAQEVRQSDRSGDRSFWQRYSDYAEMATAFCG
ncbi:hypothetical protein SAMN05421688_0838 [Poseidonocella pacifica]|uniref:Arginine transporter n=1 Tax=Poseidonocella pacifica TaxID=871651 RepID=A0A1I0VPA7_9RHOB|nr:hypothetical protein [Poseidonocella pacifica]SFA78204.1 hypothetical protein SAMN05421688_0838 [Poseidonocella pacifica]